MSASGGPYWPQTLAYATSWKCADKGCPTKPSPNVWEVPINRLAVRGSQKEFTMLKEAIRVWECLLFYYHLFWKWKSCKNMPNAMLISVIATKPPLNFCHKYEETCKDFRKTDVTLLLQMFLNFKVCRFSASVYLITGSIMLSKNCFAEKRFTVGYRGTSWSKLKSFISLQQSSIFDYCWYWLFKRSAKQWGSHSTRNVYWKGAATVF